MAQKTQTHSKYKGVLVSKTNTKKIYAKLQMQRKKLIEFLVTQLSYIGEACVKIARERGDYNDITGNLRSSISYVVLNDGEVMAGGNFVAKQVAAGYKKVKRTRKLKDGTFKEYFANVKVGGDGAKGQQEGEALLQRLKAKFPWGVVLIVCAGMEYAAFVENVRGKHVLIDAELEAERLLKQLIESKVGKLVDA